MKITTELIDHISQLSRLRLPEEEKAKMAGDLEGILAYMDTLNTLDTSGVEPLSHVFPVKNVLREDEVRPSMDRGELLKNAPAADDEVGIYGKVLPEDSITDMCKKLYATNVAAIGQTLAQIDEENVGRAVKYLSAAQRVYCFGQGGSLVIAMEAWARFITAAPQFQCIEDSHMQAMAAALSTPDDVILFFSYSGATKDMLDVLRPARRRGAKIILVTHFAKSPAAAMADVTLLCGSKEGPLQSGSVAAKMGLLFIIDVLFNEYCRTNPALTEANREATAGAISAKLL